MPWRAERGTLTEARQACWRQQGQAVLEAVEAGWVVGLGSKWRSGLALQEQKQQPVLLGAWQQPTGRMTAVVELPRS